MARDGDMMTPDDNRSDELVVVWTPDGHLDEGTIHTWLDGAFDDAQSATVSAHVDGCAQCRESVAEARGLIAGASRMVRALDAVPSNVVPMADVERAASRIVAAAVVTRTGGSRERARRAWYTQPVIRAAAAILVVVTGGTYVWSRTPTVPTTESRIAVEQAVPTVTPLSQAPTPTAARELKATVAPPARTEPQAPRRKEARADAPSRDVAVAVAKPDSTRVIASQSINPPATSANAMVSERRAISADVAAPAAPPRAMSDIGARVVSGRITTTTGAPAVGVLLTATGLSTVGATTDSSGAYRLRVAGDSVVLLARQLGFGPTRALVDLRSRDSARVDLKMAPSVMTLQSVVVASSPFISAKSVNLPTSTQGVSAMSGGIAQSNMIFLGYCWSVQASGTPAPRLPTHLATPRQIGVGVIGTTWINWPSAQMTTKVDMSSIRSGALSGSSVADQDTIMLTLTRRGNDWTGLAVQRDGTTRLERPVTLKRVSDTLCNM